MATITLKHIAETLHRELKQRAVRHHRSLNREILACLETSIHSASVDVDALMGRAHAIRQQIGGRLTDRKLRMLKQMGRV